jgi:hypothetical protein
VAYDISYTKKKKKKKNISEDQAAKQLTGAWTQQNNARKESWARQVQEDQHELEEAERAQAQAEEEQRCIQKEGDKAEQRESEKKKLKMKTFNVNLAVPDLILPRLASFMINKLENFEYIELWYFTDKGCMDATQNQQVIAEEAFRLTKHDDFISLRPISSFRASRNVVKDQDLTWRQLETARSPFLHCATKAGWPKCNTDALASFWLDIESHEFHHRPHGKCMLLIYQACVHREWHDSLMLDKGFNLAAFNESLLHTISDEVWSDVRAEGMRR